MVFHHFSVIIINFYLENFVILKSTIKFFQSLMKFLQTFSMVVYTYSVVFSYTDTILRISKNDLFKIPYRLKRSIYEYLHETFQALLLLENIFLKEYNNKTHQICKTTTLLDTFS